METKSWSMSRVRKLKCQVPGGRLWGPWLEGNTSLRRQGLHHRGSHEVSGNWEAEACVILKGPPDDSGNIKSLPIISQMNSWAFFYGLL